LDLAAENSALLVDFSLGIFGAIDLALRQSRQHAGQRIDHADFDWLFAERFDDKRRADDLTGAERKTRLNKRATGYRSYELRHYDPPRSLSAYFDVLFLLFYFVGLAPRCSRGTRCGMHSTRHAIDAAFAYCCMHFAPRH
jgi:hypothetical protein